MKALSKVQRAALREKYGGRCAYCGNPLADKWHADHVDPVVRGDWFKKGSAPDYPERHTIDNMNPSCPPCNIDKHSMRLDDWRGVIERSNDVLARDVSTFRRAVRYGLVSLRNEPVMFFFERMESPIEEPTA